MLLPSDTHLDCRLIEHIEAWLENNLHFTDLSPEKLVLEMLLQLDPETNHPYCLGKWIVIKARERILRLLPSLITTSKIHQRLDEHDERLDQKDSRVDEVEAKLETLVLAGNDENYPVRANVVSPTLIAAKRKVVSDPLNLTKEETEAMKSLLTCKHQKAVCNYTHNQKTVNEMLRSRQGDEVTAKKIFLVTQALHRLPSFAGTTYRACSFTNDQVQSMFTSRIGGMWADSAFLSTTLLSFEEHGGVELDSFNEMNVRFLIHGKTGKYIKFLSHAMVENEEEVLFLPMTWFWVVAVTQDTDRTVELGCDCWNIGLDEVDFEGIKCEIDSDSEEEEEEEDVFTK